MSKTTFVPLHSILVMRADPKSTKDNPLPDKQIDTLAEYKATGKAFEFTADEVDEIKAAFDGDLSRALRAPSDEVEVKSPEVPASSSTQAKTAKNPDASKAATAKDDGDL